MGPKVIAFCVDRFDAGYTLPGLREGFERGARSGTLCTVVGFETI